MEKQQQKKLLTVAPFECAWRDDLRFREAGRGCVAFDAFACNDVTIVFREHVGSQQYHYTRDTCPHYTVIIGSHKNKKLKIEVDSKVVVDVTGVGLCCSSTFQSYWISIYDGLISIGKGRYPFQNLCFQWHDSQPNCNVQYIGLSSWDKHVGYRNVSVLPLTRNHLSMWRHVECEHEGSDDGDEEFDVELEDYEKWGLKNFLGSWDLSDLFFLVGKDEEALPAHKVIMAASGNFGFGNDEDAIIHLPEIDYPVIYSLLEYIYTGHTLINESHLTLLRDLSLQFEVMSLLKQCEEKIEQFEYNKRSFDVEKKVEISYPSSQYRCNAVCPFGLPSNEQSLQRYYLNGQYSDVDMCIEGHGSIVRSHKIILGLWSIPFTKMFTNGMSETTAQKIILKDMSFDAFSIMLEFMYNGRLNNEHNLEFGTLLLQLLLLSDQFGVGLLHQECCKILLECLSEAQKFYSTGEWYGSETRIDPLTCSELLRINTSSSMYSYAGTEYYWMKDSVCPILQVLSSVPSFELITDMCKRKFSMHFDYCTTATMDFVMLDEGTFCSILQHSDLTVTSEERVLSAILLWWIQEKELCGWEKIEEMLLNSSAAASEYLTNHRFNSLETLLSHVRFVLLPCSLLKKLENSILCRLVPVLYSLVKEAITFVEFGFSSTTKDPYSARFQHRRSSFKELQLISNGDSNGVLYFSGTSYGRHQWINPVLSQRVIITASSPISRFTDPKVLASRTFQGTSFAGPCVENWRNLSWWMVDLGQDHQLMCNYYTIRQDGSRAFMRYWNFEGSEDGKSWTNLRRHEKDNTVRKPGQFASWAVSGYGSLLPFRYFRVCLTAPTTGDTNPWSFCICFLELYGFFR